jgi:outer membrane protein assembly factor BamB
MANHPVLVIGIHGQVLGVDAASGEIRWQDGLKGGGYGEVALAISETHVVASALHGKVFCFRYPTGEPLWEASTSAMGRATIVIEGELVFVAKNGEVDCFSLDGRRLWSQPLKGKSVGRIALGFPGNVVQADDRGSE